MVRREHSANRGMVCFVEPKRAVHPVILTGTVIWVVTVCFLSILKDAHAAVMLVAISMLIAGAVRAAAPQGVMPCVRGRLLDALFLLGSGLLLVLLAPWASMPMLS